MERVGRIERGVARAVARGAHRARSPSIAAMRDAANHRIGGAVRQGGMTAALRDDHAPRQLAFMGAHDFEAGRLADDAERGPHGQRR